MERETLREKNLEKVNRELKIRARKEASKKDEFIDPTTDEDLKRIEHEFQQLLETS